MRLPRPPASARFRQHRLLMLLRIRWPGMRPIWQLLVRAAATLPAPALDRPAPLPALSMTYWQAAPRADTNFWQLGTLAAAQPRIPNSSAARRRFLTM